jgi:putative transposase
VKRINTDYPGKYGFEALNKKRLFRHHRRQWNQRLADTDWRKITTFFQQQAATIEVPPYNTSKTCARCGYVHKDLRGEQIFECPHCGVRLNRQLNAAINIYLKMNGASQDPPWFDRVVLGGLPAIGAERSLSDELAKTGNDLMMPKQIVII